MAKRKPRHDQDPVFFPDLREDRPRRPRPHKALFIPRLLAQAANDTRHAGTDRDHAHKVLSQWADLISGGHLADRKETATDAEFLNAVFGDALGFKHKAKSPDEFQLDRAFTVPDVGRADGAIGDFPTGETPVAVIELKDVHTDLDRDRRRGGRRSSSVGTIWRRCPAVLGASSAIS